MYSNERERQPEEVPTPEPAPVDTAPVDAHLSGLRAREVLGLQRSAGNQAVVRMLAERLIQRDDIDGVDVNKTGMASWEYGDKSYHLNLLPGAYHITEEGRDESKKGKKGKKGPTKTHYFFEPVLGGDLAWTMKDAIGSGGYPGSKKKFSALPAKLQSWFARNYDDIIK